jgi:steroid 5-alpha reductase family enzyme
MKQKHFIDSHKGATCLWVLGVMWYFDSWDSTALWIYLALHGTYGIMWILKSQMFPDRTWERATGIGFALLIWASLSLYWITPVLIAKWRVEPQGWYLALAISLYTFGVFFHFAADMQKHVSLSLRPGLIDTGLWARLRNPNYFGELLIYLGFSMLAMHWIPIVALATFVLTYWVPNMLRKDKSLSRYPEFSAYKKRSFLFIPLVW